MSWLIGSRLGAVVGRHVATVLVAVAVALALTLEHVPAECREAVREILSGS